MIVLSARLVSCHEDSCRKDFSWVSWKGRITRVTRQGKNNNLLLILFFKKFSCTHPAKCSHSFLFQQEYLLWVWGQPQKELWFIVKRNVCCRLSCFFRAHDYPALQEMTLFAWHFSKGAKKLWFRNSDISAQGAVAEASGLDFQHWYKPGEKSDLYESITEICPLSDGEDHYSCTIRSILSKCPFKIRFQLRPYCNQCDNHSF